MALSAGEHFAGYRIVRLLGSGGMGEVYLAEHPRLPKRDALKVLPAELSSDSDYRARFQREADLASKLFHPHIVSVHDRGEHDEHLWIAMDYVDGLDAGRVLAGRYPSGMPLDRVISIVTAVANALDYAHKQGLLHRDVKPANIMLTHLDDEDGEERALLTDFGIARAAGDISGLTATNMTIGTVAYAAPEQLLGADLDARADQYALAATAYHLLTGATLFPHTNPAVVISHHLTAPPPALSSKRAELATLDAVLAVALAKDPKQRFSRCSDFARALAEQAAKPSTPSLPVATQPAPVQPNTAPSRSQAPASAADLQRPLNSGTQNRWPLVAAALAVVLAAVIVLAWHPWTASEPPRSQASSATPLHPSSPTPTTTTTTPTPTTTTAATPAIIDVDPADYEDRESPGYYRWAYARSPTYRECGVFPITGQSTVPEGVACDVTFPPGTPEVSNGFLSGPPNEVRIVPPDGPAGWLSEGGRPTAITLLPNHRITVGAFSCTALVGGGIDCQAPTGGFRFADGVLTTRGAR